MESFINSNHFDKSKYFEYQNFIQNKNIDSLILRFYKKKKSYSILEIIKYLDDKIDVKLDQNIDDNIGDIKINNIVGIDKISRNSISFLNNIKYAKKIKICDIETDIGTNMKNGAIIEENCVNNIKISAINIKTDANINVNMDYDVNNIKEKISQYSIACFVEEKYKKYLPKNIIPIITSNPQYCYAKVIEMFYENIQDVIINNENNRKNAENFYKIEFSSFIAKNTQIHSSVVIGQNCFIGENVKINCNVVIGNNVVIEENTEIGANTVIESGVIIQKNCIIENNVSISNSIIKNFCIIRSGAKIGQSGFGYTYSIKRNIVEKIMHIGIVFICDNVDIGCNTCIDRGVLDSTIIEDNTKIDNLVQIGHNVQIGKNCFICGNVGIAGSAIIGNNVKIGGNSGIGGHIKICDNVSIAGQSGVTDTITEPGTYIGFPAMSKMKYWRGIRNMFSGL